MNLSTEDLAKWLNLNDGTIRKWTTERYGAFLSAEARGGGGRTRMFNEQDARIFAFIADRKDKGQKRADIEQALESMHLNGWNELPEMPPQPIGFSETLVSSDAAQLVMDKQRGIMQQNIDMLEETISTLERQLTDSHERNQILQQDLIDAREQLGHAKGELSALQSERMNRQERDELMMKIGRLEYELNMLRKQQGDDD